MGGWNSEDGWWFNWLGAILFTLVLSYDLWQVNRCRLRKKSLTYSNGIYVWIELDGTTQSSTIHPEQPGGAWHNDSDGDGDGGD